ncbi:MAG TPA: hypothetical protein VKV17_00635 [Bryobacteraceae bacterium]|nr:hypothetical protein [Bryobacteraceae bacterium]
MLDPLQIGVSLPLSGTYYPGGFAVSLATNSQDVLDAAAECWGESKQEFAIEPVQIRVVVQPEGSLSPEPTFRCQRHLLAIVGDADNFAIADLDRLFGFLLVSSQTAADHRWLRWFFLEAVVYSLLAQRHVVPVHAACIVRNGAGVLLCGSSGAGKSTLSWACARSGWTFIADDCTWLLAGSTDHEAIGRPERARFRPDAVTLFPELAGLIERARPNGKVCMEVPLKAFPEIETESRCTVRCLAFLDRGPFSPSLRKLAAREALELLLRDRPTYGPQTDKIHEEAFRTLASLPSHRLRYKTLMEGRNLLTSLIDRCGTAFDELGEPLA